MNASSPTHVRKIIVAFGLLAAFTGVSLAGASGKHATALVELPTGDVVTQRFELPAGFDDYKAPNCHQLLSRDECLPDLPTNCYCGALADVEGAPEGTIGWWLEE